MRKRNIQVMIHLNEKEYNDLTRHVRKTGLSREAYIRKLLQGYVPRELPPIDYYGMMRELNAIGNNLHQISARANKTGFFLAEKYDENYKQLMEKVLEIQAAATLPEKVLD